VKQMREEGGAAWTSTGTALWPVQGWPGPPLGRDSQGAVLHHPTRTGELSAFSWRPAGVSHSWRMEATGIYWRPIYYALEGLSRSCGSATPSTWKNVPGRKTDLSDAEWLARCCRHRRMVRPSFVPAPRSASCGNTDQERYRKTPGGRPGPRSSSASKSAPGPGVKPPRWRSMCGPRPLGR